MNQIINKTIREIALAAPATTRVFEEFNIDYCCGGRRSIADACAAAGIDIAILSQRIGAVIDTEPTGTARDYPEDKNPSELIDYILAKHHIFTAEEVRRLIPLMEKVATRHGEHYPSLLELKTVFTALTNSLIPHMQREENVLFPHIKMLEASLNNDTPAPVSHFGTVQNPVRMMMSEHDADGERLEHMRAISGDYQLPDDACPSFTALFAGLQDLERDLHRHIHLENNVLFPASLELETKASQR